MFTEVRRSIRQVHSTSVLACLLICCALASGCLNSSANVGTSTVVNTPATMIDEQSLAEGQWPGWRGAMNHGVSAETGLPKRWSVDEGYRWKASVPGSGNSSPVVWDEHIFLTSLITDESGQRLALLCFDKNAGQLVWQRELGPPIGRTHDKNGFASATVTTDGRRVYAFFGPRGLFCYDAEGRRQWHAPLDDLDGQWGTAASPIIFGDLVIQLCDSQSDSYIAAFNKLTGDLVWRTQRNSQGCWSTPVLVQVGDKADSAYQLVVNGTGSPDGSAGYVIAYDPATGQQLWQVRGTTDIPCPTAIVADGLVISSSGGNGPIMAIQPGGRGDVTETHVVWKQPSGGPYVPTGVAYDGWLFTISDGGVAKCYDLTDGRELWKKRLRGTFSASLIAGDGCIYATCEQGRTYVFAAADEFDLIETNSIGERCLATPAISRNDLLLRTADHLYCIASTLQANAVVPEAADTSDATSTPSPSVPVSSPSDRNESKSVPLPKNGDAQNVDSDDPRAE